MANFTWNATGTASLGTPSNWIENGAPATTVPGPGDIALMANTKGAYQVTVQPAAVADVAGIIFSTNGAANTASFSISGSLTTGFLTYLSTGSLPSLVTINAGGLFDVTTTLSNSTKHAETINISSGTGGPGTGGELILGSLTVGDALSSGRGPIAYTFQTPAGEAGGVIDFATGFVTGGATNTTTQTITGVAWGDEFRFEGADFTGAALNYSGTTLTVTEGGVTVLTMSNVAAGAGTTFTAFGDVIEALCYARGTMIRTPDGELRVERLRPGRQVIALVDGQEVPQTVTWLGHRRIDLTAHPHPETVAPIRIERDAFADNMPHRDLVVSPDHAMFVDGKLICARQLVNGTTIRQERGWTAVDYYHVELDKHAILLAEGQPAESYIDTGNRGFFSNSGEPLVLHPDLTDETGYPTREAGSCAPFVSDEASVRPVWQRLADRAAAIGRPLPQRMTTTDADLRLMAHGRMVKPIYGDDKLVIFTLPRSTDGVRLVSRAQSPTEARPWLDDRRQLGVRVARLVLRGPDEVREVPVDHPDLVNGWWAVERDGQAISRWTDGKAALPLPPRRGLAMLEVHLVGAMTYVVETAPAGEPTHRAA